MQDVANRPTMSIVFGTEFVSPAILQDRPRLPHRPVSSLSGICPKLSMDDAYQVVSLYKKVFYVHELSLLSVSCTRRGQCYRAGCQRNYHRYRPRFERSRGP